MSKFRAVALAVVCVCLSESGTIVSGANPAEDIYKAIRANDLTRLKALVTTKADANVKDEIGQTPLMYSAFAGSVDAMKFLIAQGADVDAQTAFGSTALIYSATEMAKVRALLDAGANVNAATKTGRTALFVAAMSEPSAPIVRLLASKGADVKVRDAFGNTTLVAAAVGNDLDTIRFVLDAGVDVNEAGKMNVTPLVESAYHGNTAAVKLLLSKGAKPNVVALAPVLFPLEFPKSGPIALGNVTPLLAAASSEQPQLVKALLDAGADVNAKDGRNMTPLMIAVATNRQNAAVIRMLVDRGADATVQSSAGETAVDWARKLGVPAALDILKVTRTRDAAPAAPPAATVDAKTAAERSMALLESSSQRFFEGSGCVSCHHQNVADLAAGEARAKGIRVDADAALGRMKMLAAGPPAPLLLERMDIGVPEIVSSTLTALAAVNVPSDRVTDTLAAHIAATQAADGSWHVLNGVGARPPAEEGAITRTALCVRSLKVYGPPARGTEMNARITKARQWLLAAKPVTSEERNMRLLGLYWAGADPATLKPLAAEILARQQGDGGWRQIDTLASDAYATGQSLYALARAGGVPPTDAAYARGVNYLLSTQNANGSWRVTSRSPKFQAYFNSGFPYAGDQWISAWATGWATMALAQAVN